MSNLAKIAPRMTSREISDLTGKEHFHVVRDIETMFEQLEMRAEGYLQNWRHPQNGQEYKGYSLPEDLILTLVSGYNAKLRHRIIKRWKELEGAAEHRKRLRHEVAGCNKAMNGILALQRKQEGKSCERHHFMNEAKLINHFLLGKFKGADRDSLSSEQLDLLAKLEMHNTLLIAKGLPYAERKVQLAIIVRDLLAELPDTQSAKGVLA
jgi:phage regulator Rha-like protein